MSTHCIVLITYKDGTSGVTDMPHEKFGDYRRHKMLPVPGSEDEAAESVECVMLSTKAVAELFKDKKIGADYAKKLFDMARVQ